MIFASINPPPYIKTPGACGQLPRYFLSKRQKIPFTERQKNGSPLPGKHKTALSLSNAEIWEIYGKLTDDKK
ncbi:hypothetical protein HMPREF1986_02495 [Oribacterium sp. oral taxon 078 str. F0263]|nr:hypothetical protein HMPREF1986_02495 [Oribacterium sp. oral taxon 078 str. F0263]